MNIRRVTEADIHSIAVLFDLYRQFYQCPADPKLSTDYITERFSNNESVIFIAVDEDAQTIGFVQIYPSYCSIDAGKILILHDLYVQADRRKQGVARLLMDRATEYARETGALRINLLTDKTNYAGQALYEKIGYQKALQDFYAYSLKP